MNTILETENLRKEFFLSYFPKRTILACDDINVSIKEGDEVEIFGDSLPVTEMAKILKTIPYEIYSTLNRRLKRIYFD